MERAKNRHQDTVEEGYQEEARTRKVGEKKKKIAKKNEQGAEEQ